MTWETAQKEFSIRMNELTEHLQLTDIECPECGEAIYRDTSVVLTSFPAKYHYTCKKCGWGDCGF